MSFDYYDWDKEIIIQQFVQEFFDQKHLFTSHEIEYLKNNCKRYPKTKHQELNEFQELVDQIDFDKIHEKAKEKFDRNKDWNINETKDNPFSEIWDSSGMYEKQNGVGMFGSEEEIERMIKLFGGDE
jgi:esterase/lipase